MNLYTIRSLLEQAYLIDAADNGDCCEPDPPHALGRTWVVPELELIVSDEFEEHRPKMDFPRYLPSVMMVSAKAVDRLRPILANSGEILPIRVINDPDDYYFFNVTRVVNAVDMEHSIFRRLPSGGIMSYERLIFDPKKLPTGPAFFKTTQLGPVTEIYATEAAVRAVEDANLTGHDFRLVWSSE